VDAKKPTYASEVSYLKSYKKKKRKIERNRFNKEKE